MTKKNNSKSIKYKLNFNRSNIKDNELWIRKLWYNNIKLI